MSEQVEAVENDSTERAAETADSVTYSPQTLKLWVCCTCLAPRLYGSESACYVCGKLLHETALYVRTDIATRPDNAAEICAEMARAAAMRAAKARSDSEDGIFDTGAAAQFSAQCDALREAEKRIRSIATRTREVEVWSKEFPTDSGWYWMRGFRQYRVLPVEVTGKWFSMMYGTGTYSHLDAPGAEFLRLSAPAPQHEDE